MNDEIAHMGIVDGALRGPFPSIICAGVVRIHTDDIELIQVLELDALQVSQNAAKHQMKQLFLRFRLF